MKTMLLGTVFTAVGLIASANAEQPTVPAPVTATEAVAPAVSTADGLKSDPSHAHPMQKGEESLSNDKSAVPAKKAKSTAKHGKKHTSHPKVNVKEANGFTDKLNSNPSVVMAAPAAIIVPVVPVEIVESTTPAA